VFSISRMLSGFLKANKSPDGGNQRGAFTSEETDMVDFTFNGTDTQILKSDIAWLKLRLDRGRKEKFAEFSKLTPSLARLLLTMNGSNRHMSEYRARSYAKDISEGRWQVNGETLAVSSCGHLNDGQHRCNAVIIADTPIDALFTFGVSYESRLTTDTGAVKGAGDFLGMEGIQNANNLAAIAHLLLIIEKNGKYVSGINYVHITKSEVRERVESDPGVERSFIAVRQKNASKLASLTVLAVCHYLLSKVDSDKADHFMTSLISGAELKDRDPIYVAREKLIDPYKRLNKNEQLKTILSAWNSWRSGRMVRTIVHLMKKGEVLPEIK